MYLYGQTNKVADEFKLQLHIMKLSSRDWFVGFLKLNSDIIYFFT